MRVTFIGSFVKQKTGIERVNFEILKKLVLDPDIEKIHVIAPPGKAQIDEDLLLSGKILTHEMIIGAKSFKVFYSTLNNSEVCIIANIRPLGILAHSLKKFFLKKKIKIVQFVPDLIVEYFPDVFPWYTKVIFRAYRLLFVNSPDFYVVHSKATERDLVKLWKVEPGKIVKVYLGSFIKTMEPRKNFEGRKILYVGTIEPRKNIDKLLDAFEIVKKRIPEAELIIAGKKGWKVEDLMLRIGHLVKNNSGVKYLGYVSDDELINLYKSADVFVYLSIYEGFGLPLVEAMACGCPVITSNISSMPEVVGDAGLTVDPSDVKKLAETIVLLLTDKKLQRDLSLRSINRAKEFDMDLEIDKLTKLVKQR